MICIAFIIRALLYIVQIPPVHIIKQLSQMNNELKELQDVSTAKSHAEINNFEFLPESTHLKERKYGNLIILLKTDKFFITLGPDYPCLIFALLSFLILYIFTIKHIFNNNDSLLGVLSIIGAMIQLLIYILLAISNPGIATSENIDTEEEDKCEIKRYCRECNIPIKTKTRHCTYCQVCIKGYDHHCPWTSKCIGENNIWRFYAFCGYTPVYICYCIIVLCVDMS